MAMVSALERHGQFETVSLRRLERIDIKVLPPCEFVTALVQLPMVRAA